jgi:nucleoside-diphosphate-sugar epimerase
MTEDKQQKRLFITGGSGYIGSVVIELAIADGYDVHALSRTPTSDAQLSGLGAVAVRGDLESLDVVRRESADADVVIHLATAYTLSEPSYDTVWPVDKAALDAMADALAGTGKPLVTTSGTLLVAADPTGVETTESSPENPNPINSRGKAERHALGFAGRGIRVTSVRLAPYVYGRGGSGVQLFMGMAAGAGGVTCVDGGQNHTTVVHVDDAARLFLVAAQRGKAGDVFNASGATDVTARKLFEAMAAALGLPVWDIAFADAEARMGKTVATFLTAENRASGAKAAKELGWHPKGVGILEDISKGSYQAVAALLRK